ncbi:peptidylprolyl isomerase [uncultured Rikenella sp.]|uniref:peptidylprolyl isomerase n=1 Tax=uncultured Rikenella sp. TaxID=368003 RepID=UPI0025FE08D8|nr:peptidylprolyl isomerase [uncultured Rikenella sp.]
MTKISIKLVKIFGLGSLALLSGFGIESATAARKLVAGQGAHYVVKMKTSRGTVRFRLYNDTPLHRDNFVRLAERGFYDNLLFHRVIRDFMIQTGDPQSIEGSQVTVYGENDAGYKLDAEIVPRHYHRRGAVAAAREGDALNPERRSSGSQFYIVTGRVHNDSTLTAARHRIAAGAADPAGAQITPQRERVYRTAGGAPHLDGSYTVFGEVIGGMGRVVRISKLPTDSQDRPKNEDVYIKSMTVKVVKDRRRDR